MTSREIKKQAMAYIRANHFLTELRSEYRWLTPQEYRTLRGQAISGDIDGAEKGLLKLKRRRIS